MGTLEPISATTAQVGFTGNYHVSIPTCTVEHHAYLELELEGYRKAMARLERFFATKPGLMAELDSFEG